MSVFETDWQSFLSPGSKLPPDVFFLVKDEEGESKTVGAHKFLLAGVSPSFQAMFFGPMPETRELVEVKETTFEAFDTMVKYIYNPPGLFNLDQIRCPQKLFDVLAVANKYQILKLSMMTSDVLESLAITRDGIYCNSSKKLQRDTL